MKFFDRFFRNEEQTKVIGIEVWVVRWLAVESGSYSGRLYVSGEKEVAEFFTSKGDAMKFKSALEDAFKITRNTLNRIEVNKEVG